MFGLTAFGFKGVEFGNWVEQTKRQSDLNEAFDALMDMAAILALVPPKAIQVTVNGASRTSALRSVRADQAAWSAKFEDPAVGNKYEPGKVVITLSDQEERRGLARP